jgi:sigma-70-like protein
VLETLTPAERLAYVLHDMFSVPFDQIGAILERSPEATRQLASRGRRRIRAAHTTPHADTAAREKRSSSPSEALCSDNLMSGTNASPCQSFLRCLLFPTSNADTTTSPPTRSAPLEITLAVDGGPAPPFPSSALYLG